VPAFCGLAHASSRLHLLAVLFDFETLLSLRHQPQFEEHTALFLSPGSDEFSPNAIYEIQSAPPTPSVPQSSSPPPLVASAGLPHLPPLSPYLPGPAHSPYPNLPPRRSQSASPGLYSPSSSRWGPPSLPSEGGHVLPIRPQPLRCPPESAALASVVMQFLPGLGAPPAASESDSSSEPSTGSARQGWRRGLKEMVVAEYLKLTTAMAKASAANGRMPLSPPLSPHPGHKTARGHPQVHYPGQREMQLSPPHLPKCASTSQIAALGELALEPMPGEGAGFRKPKLEVLASPGAFAALSLASPCGAPAPRWSSGDGEEGARGASPPAVGPPEAAAAAEPGLGGGAEGSWGTDGEQPQEPRLRGACSHKGCGSEHDHKQSACFLSMVRVGAGSLSDCVQLYIIVCAWRDC
jgi:hypothetical protein